MATFRNVPRGLKGVFKKLEIEITNGHILQKNDSHFVANKDSRILMYNS